MKVAEIRKLSTAELTVESTKLAGARDFLVVPALHTFFCDNAQVQQSVLEFLQHGYFVSDERRQPLEKATLEKAP